MQSLHFYMFIHIYVMLVTHENEEILHYSPKWVTKVWSINKWVILLLSLLMVPLFQGLVFLSFFHMLALFNILFSLLGEKCVSPLLSLIADEILPPCHGHFSSYIDMLNQMVFKVCINTYIKKLDITLSFLCYFFLFFKLLLEYSWFTVLC